MLTNLPSTRLLPVIFALALGIGTLGSACKKTVSIALPPSQVSFLNQQSGDYFITGAGVTDTIPVGVTTVSAKDRVIPIIVNSPSGTTKGVAYDLASDSVTIPAGQALGYIVVKGNFAYYDGTTRKDTLIFTFAEDKMDGIAPSDFNDSFTLVMRGPCVEGEDFNPAEFNGFYDNSIDEFGSYSTLAYPVFISTTSTGPTSAVLLIQNLGAGIFGPFAATDHTINPGITVNLDWSNPPNLTATVINQSFENDMQFGEGQLVLGAAPGSFSSCHQIFTLNYDVSALGGGFDFGIITTVMGR